jgi:hypothetical protein
MKGIKHKKPMETRNGRPRLKAFSVPQLEELLSKTSIPKLKQKIHNQIVRKSKV